MIRTTLALILSAGILSAATGDIQSVTIRADGWTADVAIEGLNTGGTYEFGLGANNAITGSEKVVFTVVSHSFDDTGAATTKTRTVYGVKAMRKAYQNDASNEETNSGGTTTVRVILSDYIYDEDDSGAGNSGTAITATFLSGFYNQSATPTNATVSPITVTNSSTVPFQSVISNWAWPGYQRMTASTKLRAVAFHRHGEQGRPVRAVKFSVTDGTTTNTETVTTPTYDPSFGDEVPVVEYVTTTDLTSGLTNGAELTCNFIAYPWIGDNAADSSTGAAAPSPLVGPIKAVCDRTGGYGVTYAVVDVSGGSDPSVGSDSGKWVGDGADPGSGSGVTAYASIGRAARAIRDYNNANRSRDDVGGGIIFLKAGSYNWLGATISGTYGSAPKTWITVKPFTGVARADVVITGSSGNTDISDRVKLEGITINTTTSDTFSGCLAMWLHDCDITSTAAGTWNTSGQRVWITHSDINGFTQGLRPFSTTDMVFPLVRGCNLDGFDGTILAYTVLGNANNVPATSLTIQDEITGQTAPRTVPILAFNKILGLSAASSERFIFGKLSANTTGLAVVQNVVENYAVGSAGLGQFGVSNFEHSNCIIWHNTIVGQRLFVGYNDTGSTAYYRKYWSQLNNYFDRWANKGDNFSPQDGARVGGWPVKFNVGSSGNYLSQNMYSLPGDFYSEFSGLSSYEPNTSSYGLEGDALFVDRQSAVPNGLNSATAGSGGGDYEIDDASPLVGLPIRSVIGYDIGGNVRDDSNTAAGAYAGGSVVVPQTTLNAETTNAATIIIGTP